MMSQLPMVVKELSGFDLEDWLKKMADGKGGQKSIAADPKSKKE